MDMISVANLLNIIVDELDTMDAEDRRVHTLMLNNLYKDVRGTRQHFQDTIDKLTGLFEYNGLEQDQIDVVLEKFNEVNSELSQIYDTLNKH